MKAKEPKVPVWGSRSNRTKKRRSSIAVNLPTREDRSSEPVYKSFFRQAGSPTVKEFVDEHSILTLIPQPSFLQLTAGDFAATRKMLLIR